MELPNYFSLSVLPQRCDIDATSMLVSQLSPNMKSIKDIDDICLRTLAKTSMERRIVRLSMNPRTRFVAHFLKFNDTAIFLLNFFAIIPLAKLFEIVIEDISRRTGQTTGALLDATFGNLPEFVLAIIALKQGQVRVVQASVMGNLISNLLLVIGSSFLVGGIKYQVQEFNETAAQTTASLMAVACIALVVPAAFNISIPGGKDYEVVKLSHYTAIILLIVYGLCLLFPFKTHPELYITEDEEDEEPELTLIVSAVTLAVTTVIVGFCGEFLVSSISRNLEPLRLTKTFVGLILFPLVGRPAEAAMTAKVAMKNKMQSVIFTVAARSLQTALFFTPSLVVLGWIIDQPMTLLFEMFETIVLFISVLLLNYLIQNGRSNWFAGILLLATYNFVAIASYLYPD
ncbi:4400_t:CDS:2 [Paraglomus brasilianum]|uniref:Vacuolar calcium ion transporter n=1 Tax=Paraglomus brasilianum TaxID=144538 RepID=A0A9N9GA73_9GLOM|nr:4400_t:CDS:2 [Paraglomus brasilianum]